MSAIENIELPAGFSRRQLAVAVSPKIQELILFPTEKCNFRCTYCYEDFEIGKMSKQTQEAVKNLISRRAPHLKKLSFSWFGGEPLLAKDVVFNIAKHAYEVCKAHDIHFSGGLTTNAYLLDRETAEQLIEYRQDFYQITLDGHGDMHDVLRRRADGKGTFNQIWENLVALKQIPKRFECLLRIHVRRDNIDNLEFLMKEIAKEFQYDSRYRLDFQHLRDMGGEGGTTVVEPLTLPELREVENHLRSVLRANLPGHPSLPFHEGQNSLEDSTIRANAGAGESASSQRAADMVAGENYICYASKPNSLAIRANGRIGKCTVALSDDRNDLGYLDDDGSVIINNSKLHPWIRGLETLDEKTVGCPLGGLPQLNLASPAKKIIQIKPV